MRRSSRDSSTFISVHYAFNSAAPDAAGIDPVKADCPDAVDAVVMKLVPL
jgi:hypothetical protein